MPPDLATLQWPHVSVDLERAVLRFSDDTTESLTRLEVGLLAFLAQRDGVPVPTQELLTEVWGYRSTVKSRAVTFAVNRLRIKLERNGHPRILETVRGRGFRLVVPKPSPLVGRDDALRALNDVLAERHWACLHGVAGVGKTALVTQWATGRDASIVDASRGDGLDALALALGLAGKRGDRHVREQQIASAIAANGGVFVLDGLDEVPSSLVHFLEQLTAGAVLVVSRSPVDGPCLALPPLSTASARHLFRSEVASVNKDWEARDEAIDWIVDRLGLLPRPILLTARAAHWFSPAVLLNRLQEHLAVWPADRAVEGAVAWATGQLDADALRVFCALAVCGDGVTVEDLEGMSLCRDTLGALVLLQQTGLVVGERRVRLAAGVRPHALVALDQSGETDTLREAHQRWFLARPHAWRQHLQIAEACLATQPTVAARALRAALPRLPSVLTVHHIRDHIQAVANHTEPLDLSLRSYLAWCRLRMEGPSGLRSELMLVEQEALDAGDEVAASQAAGFLGALELETRHPKAARAALQRAVAYVPEHRFARGRARSALAIVANLEGALAEARELLVEALVDVEGDAAGQLMTRSTLGNLHLREGRLDEAALHFQLALEHLDQLDGSPAAPTRAVLLSNLAVVRMAQGALTEAQRLHEHAADAHRRSGRARSLGLTLASLARVHHLRDELPSAIDGYREAIERLTRVDAPMRTLWTRVFLFGALAEQGAAEEAALCRNAIDHASTQDPQMATLLPLLNGYDALLDPERDENGHADAAVEALLGVTHAELRPHRDRLLQHLRPSGD